MTLLGLLDEVRHDGSLHADVFAYDLNEPDVISALLALARDGRCRVVIDSATLHHSTDPATPTNEDWAAAALAAISPDAVRRRKFGRYSHDKVVVVRRRQADGTLVPVKVLTGSTNFSVTGLYVNANHLLVFDDAAVAAAYAGVFDLTWATETAGGAWFAHGDIAAATFSFGGPGLPRTEVRFSPHTEQQATDLLDALAARVKEEGTRAGGNVLFAVMGIADGGGAVYPVLRDLHDDPTTFSYGISDDPGGVFLLAHDKLGKLVTGKPYHPVLPAPFDQVYRLSATMHQIHHKFVVCGLGGPDPVVYCGSSNLALGGEQANGDNLLTIHGADVATAFAIEALALVDHFDFLDRRATTADTPQAATTGGGDQWFLGVTDTWAKKYFDPHELKCLDRELFGVTIPG